MKNTQKVRFFKFSLQKNHEVEARAPKTPQYGRLAKLEVPKIGWQHCRRCDKRKAILREPVSSIKFEFLKCFYWNLFISHDKKTVYG